MIAWHKCRKWLWLTAIVPTSLIIIWPTLSLIAVLWIWVIGYCYYYFEHKHYKQLIDQALTSQMKRSITTMNHHRHDWMNDLQVLFGYISLNKKERCIEYVDKIRNRMAVESAIAKLEEPKLVSYLQSFRTFASHFELVISFSENTHQESITIYDEQVSEAVIEIISAYRLYAMPGYEQANILELHFNNDNEEIRISFKYVGNLHNEDIWKQKINQLLSVNQSVKLKSKLLPSDIELQLN